MAMKFKSDLQADVFSGISSVFAVKDGFKTSGGAVTVQEGEMYEFPVSDDSGVNVDTGAATTTQFKIKGLNATWASTFTPGDGEIKLEIPCNETGIMKLCFGNEGSETTVTLPSAVKVGGKGKLKGQAYALPSKAVELGLIIVDDTETKAVFIKKAKFMAQATFDGSKPLCVVLTGTMNAGAEKDAFGILAPSDGM